MWKMNPFGYVIIIKRTGTDGYRYPLNQTTCLFGRDTECDIRLQLPVVSKQQCKIEFNEPHDEAVLINLNSANPTQLNGATFSHPVKLQHGDLITIFDRSFRFEYENGFQNEGKPRRPSEPRNKEVTPTRSRSSSVLGSEQYQKRDKSFRDIPMKYTEENSTKQFPLIHSLEEKENASKSKNDDDASDNVEEHLTGKVPTLKNKEEKESTNNVTETAVSISSGGSDSCGGDESLFSTLEHPGKSEKHHFSPFRKLFGLMKEELSCKCQQIGDCVHRSSRKSGPTSLVSTDGREWGTELPHFSSKPSLHGSKTLTRLSISGAKEGEQQLEDSFKNYSLEEWNDKKAIREAQDQELQQLGAPRKRRKSEELENSRKRKSKNGKDKRRSAPVGPLLEPQSQHSLYRLRSQTKSPEMGSGRLPKLGREPLEPQESKAMPAEKPILKESDSNGAGETVDLGKNKGSFKGRKSGNQLTPKKASNSEQIVKKIQDELDFEDVSESDGSSAKRRRVSFGVHLKPELFDENLPPNTPLKKGESPGIRRTSFGNCPPRTVLKKPIIKERSKLPEEKPSSDSLVEGTLHVQDLSLELPTSPRKKTSVASSDDSSQSYLMDESADCVPIEIQPRKIVNTPSCSRRLSSGRRSQFDTLQTIYAKRRSGASEANLMVVHSWADVVRLGTIKPQAGVVKHGLERRIIKKQKRLITPKKPVNQAQNHFSTGHANSPRTIVIGRAHTEKVTVPIRPCRMLNNFVLNPKMDMNEDLTGLADMFETPTKPQSPETGTTLQPLSEGQSSSSAGYDESSGPTSDDFERVMIPNIVDTGRQISGQSITCRRSPRNRQSRGGDDEIIKTQQEISENGSDEIMKISLPDVDADHEILTPSSKKMKTYTPKENVPTPCLNRTETPEDQIEDSTTQKITPRRGMEQSIALGGDKHHLETTAIPNSKASIVEDISVIKGATEIPSIIPSNKGEQPKENSVDIHIDLRNQKPKMSGQLGVTTSLEIGSNKEQPVTYHPSGLQKHRRNSLQKEEYSPTGANKMIRLKPDIVSLDVLASPPAVIVVKHKLGGTKKVIRTPKEKIEPTGIREMATTISVAAKQKEDRENKVADSVGDDANVQKNLRTTPKQVVCSAGDAEVPKKLVRTVKQNTEVENLPNMEQLMNTPKRKWEPEHLTVVKRLMRTPKDKAEPREDVAGSERLMRTPKEKEKEKEPVESHKSNGNVNVRHTPKHKGQSIEDLVGLSRCMHTPKEKREPQEDLTSLKELRTTPKQMEEPVKDEKVNKAIMKSDQKNESVDLTGISSLIRTPKEREELIEDMEVVKKSAKTSKQKCDPVEYLASIKKLNKTPKMEPIEDMTGLGKLKTTPKEKIKPVDNKKPTENLIGSKRFMRTPKEKIKPTVVDSSITGFTRLFKTPKVKGKPVEDLSGIKGLMRTPKVKGQPIEDLTVIKRLMRTPKVKGQPVEDLTGIKRLMRTPKVKGQPVEDLTGIKGLMRTPKVKGQPVEDLTGIKGLMRTPKVKGQPVEDLTGIKGLMRTPKVKGQPVEDLTGIKGLMRTPKVKGQPVEDLTGIKGLMRTPKVKVQPVEDLTGIKRLMRTPKVKGQPVEDLTGIKRLMRTPKVKGQPVEDLTDVTMFMETPDKVAENMSSGNTIMQSDPQEISDIDSEFSEKLQEIEILRRPAMKDFRGSNLEAEPKSKESSFEIDYMGFKEMFESPKENKDQTVDQCQQKICSNPCKDENQSNNSKIDGLCSLNLEDNIMDQGILSLSTQKNKISQAVQEHDLPSKTENMFREKEKKEAKKSLLSFQDEIKATSDNQRIISLRSRSKNKSDTESVGSTKIHLNNDEKIVKTSWDRSMKEMVGRRARVTSQSIVGFYKADKGLQEASSLSPSEKEEKEEHVKNGPIMFSDPADNTESMVPLKPRRRNQAGKEVKTSSSDRSHLESSEQKSVKNLREGFSGIEVMLRSRNKARELPSESDVSHKDDEKKLSKRLPRKVNERITPLRFSRKNKMNKELEGSSPLLSETDILGKEKNERKEIITALRSRNRMKTSTVLQESSSLIINNFSSHKEGCEKKPVKILKEETSKKRIINKGMMALRSRNKNKEMFPSETDNSYTDDEKESVKSLPEKLKGQKKLLESSNRNNTVEELNSLSRETDESHMENDEKNVKSYQGKTVVNEVGVALRTRSRNKSSTGPCIENKEKKPTKTLQARWKTTAVNEKVSLRSRNRSKCAKESQELNALPAKVLNELQTGNDEKKPVKAFQKLKDGDPNKEMAALRTRSKNKVDKESQGSNTLSTETDGLYNNFPGKFMSLRSRSKNKFDPITQEIAYAEKSEKKPLKSFQEKKVKESTAKKTSLQSGSRSRGVRLLPSSFTPEELYLKDEKKPVKVQKNLNDMTGNGEMMSLRTRSKNKMDMGLKGSNPVPTSQTYTEKDADKSMSFLEVFKNSVGLEGILPLTRNRRNKVNQLKEICRVPSATEIVEANEKKFSSLENKAEDKVSQPFRTGSRNEADGELHSFPLLNVTEIAYTEKNQEETENKLKDGVVTDDLVSLIRSLRNKNSTELIRSNPLPETMDISPLGKDGKENIQIFPGGVVSQASLIGTRLRNRSNTNLQRSANLSKVGPSTAASRTTVVTAKKSKHWKQVNTPLLTKKRRKLRTASIKPSELTDVENYSVSENHLLKSAEQQHGNFKATILSAKETQGSEPLLREGSTPLNNTNQTGENDALSGNEIWSRRLSNSQEEPNSQERRTLGSRRRYTLKETKPLTRSSKQNNSDQTAKRNIKA
ncbi:proliferation marker protein Ki-67 [Trichosurus vulpecula]|uniref:proliferation marker protein Ki-67 n=1 Tax=Trichosurus vulpecula TaxID=9337 RepID=UPI00186AD7C7|nr:proliferation marker protein Ki-67 [Trichosurus vulpecula]